MILVTGGCGYIGSHIVKALTESGEEVLVFDNLSFGSKKALLHNEKLIVGDITNLKDLKKVFDLHSIDLVIHCAALVNAAESDDKSDEYKRVNDQGSKNVWEVATSSGVKHFIYLSSAAVYGNPEGVEPITESAPLNPTNPYGETKLAGEKSLKKLNRKNNLNYAIFRFFNVGGAESEGRIGQARTSRAITQVLLSAAIGKNDHVTIYGNDYDTPDGTVIRDFIHIEDIVNAVIKATNHLKKDKQSFTLNLGSGKTTSINQLINTVKEVTKKDIKVEYGSRKPGDISYSLADITKAKTILGWEPQKTLKDIVKDGFNYFTKK